MGEFTVTDVIDGDTIEVDPEWNWNDESGNRVRLAGVDAPEVGKPGSAQATRRLTNLVYGRSVDLDNAVAFSYGRLVCDVFVNGRKVVP